jgi:hypothetical protein
MNDHLILGYCNLAPRAVLTGPALHHSLPRLGELDITNFLFILLPFILAYLHIFTYIAWTPQSSLRLHHFVLRGIRFLTLDQASRETVQLIREYFTRYREDGSQ